MKNILELPKGGGHLLLSCSRLQMQTVPVHLKKKEFLFFRRVSPCVHGCCRVLSCQCLWKPECQGFGEPRCLLRESPERNLTEKSHKTSFKEQAEIACLSSTASLSTPPPTTTYPPPTLSPAPSSGALSCLIHIRWRRTGWEWQHLQANLLRGSTDVYIWWTVSGRGGGGFLSLHTPGSVPSSLCFSLHGSCSRPPASQ